MEAEELVELGPYFSIFLRKPLCRTVGLSIAVAVVGLDRNSSSLFLEIVRSYVAEVGFVAVVVEDCFLPFLGTSFCA